MIKTPGSGSVKRAIISKLLLLAAVCMLFAGSVSVQAAKKVTVYNGVDYAKVYNFDYYVSHFSVVKRKYANNPSGALKYFVTVGIPHRHRACETFSVTSYIYGNVDLRRLYKNDYKKYYQHYMTKGYKQASRKNTFVGVKGMQKYATTYDGFNYAKVYSYHYYIKKYPAVFKTYKLDDLKVLENFVKKGTANKRQANAKFNVARFIKANPALKKKYGTNYLRYYRYYCKYGDPSGTINRKYEKTINGKRTLKSYLQNAMVPVGRTLYIWGGGWGGTDTSIIGYQSSWKSFFNEHKGEDYDYNGYRFNYGKGLDCSGFAAWTLYNTLYTKDKQAELVTQSTTVASSYAKKGWATLSTDPSNATFRPGDVVSMNGHVWISLGQFSDGSILLVHSSPKGVQISGTSGKAGEYAKYYMKKYFPEWPYEARTVGSSYFNYAGKARWKVSGKGAIMSDPDGIQKMSAAKVMETLFG